MRSRVAQFGWQRRFGVGTLLFAMLFAQQPGCMTTGESIAEHEVCPASLELDADDYVDQHLSLSEPTCPPPVETDAIATAPPRRIRHPQPEDIRDLSLQETLHTALANNPIIRQNNEFLATTSPFLANIDRSGSISTFDPAIQATDFLIGRRGVEAALADFDAQFTTTFQYGNSETVQNSPNLNLRPGEVFDEETGGMSARLEKQFATGGSFAFQSDISYSDGNTTRLFPSAYTGFARAELRQPLWAGAGTEFTRIAGPVGTNLQNLVVGLNQGVAIARINEDISLADFELAVAGLLRDTEESYWDLYLAYRRYDAESAARASAARNLKRVEAIQGLPGGSVTILALARENYFDATERTQIALAELYTAETRLRRLIGLPVNDGRVLRPTDEPVRAFVEPDWEISLAQAIAQRVELRRQRWNIRSLELQLVAAKSLTNPRLDLVSSYQLNGFGDRLFSDNNPSPNGNFASVLGSIASTQQDSWTVGVELSMPLGFRTAHLQVRNTELRLAKARAALREQELEVSHELADSFQNLDRFYTTAATARQRREAAAQRSKAAEFERNLRELSPEGVDLLLRADISLRDAEIAYFSNLVEYTKSISRMHFRKGTIFDYNNVHLAEGRWEPKAYQDAIERALERTHGIEAELVEPHPGLLAVPHGRPVAEPLMRTSHWEEGAPPEPTPVPNAPGRPVPAEPEPVVPAPSDSTPADPKPQDPATSDRVADDSGFLMPIMR